MTDKQKMKKSMSNYWYYYKYHTMIAIFVIVVIIATVVSSIGTVKDDLVFDYIGKTSVDTAALSDKVTSNFTSIIKDINNDGKKKIQFQGINLGGGPELVQKAVVEISVSDTTSFILDEDAYLEYAAQGAFQPLDDLAAKYNIDATKYPNLKVKEAATGESHIYAIPLENSSFLNNVTSANKKLYYAVRVKDQTTSSSNDKKNMYESSMLIAETLAAGIK
jgi:hypothetical protein